MYQNETIRTAALNKRKARAPLSTQALRGGFELRMYNVRSVPQIVLDIDA